jgi:hypothetical protein
MPGYCRPSKPVPANPEASPSLRPDAGAAIAYLGAGRTLPGALRAGMPSHKPPFWWAKEREPWKRVSADIKTDGDPEAAMTRADAAAPLVPAISPDWE